MRCHYFLWILGLILAGRGLSQNEFDKYGVMGSKVYTDLKVALDVEKNVYKMDLSYQKLEPKYYNKLGKLKDLQALKLSGNEVSTYPPNFSELYNLMYFASYNNAFATFPPDLKKLANLNYLELFGTKIDTVPADIAYLSKLKTFKISSTNDTLKLPTTFRYLKGLTDLTIENCVLDSFPKEAFKAPSLRYLNLTNVNMFYLTRHFERFGQLEVLVLDANHLADIPRDIYKAKNLRLLSLKNNKLDKLPDTICLLENLALLDIRGNNFSKNEIEVLKALLPGCEIRYDAVK